MPESTLATSDTQNLIETAIMSDTANSKTEETATFSEKEQRLIVAAMGSLKPEVKLDIDMETFMKLGHFNAKKTAQNQWGLLKKKLMPATNGEAGVTVPAIPKPKTPAKKRTKKESDEEDVAEAETQEQGSAPKKAKTPKKTPAKKGNQTGYGEGAGEEAAVDDGSPKKRGPGRPAKPRGKKIVAATKEEETEEATATGTTDADVKTEAEADDTFAKLKETTPPGAAAAAVALTTLVTAGDTKMEDVTDE